MEGVNSKRVKSKPTVCYRGRDNGPALPPRPTSPNPPANETVPRCTGAAVPMAHGCVAHGGKRRRAFEDPLSFRSNGSRCLAPSIRGASYSSIRRVKLVGAFYTRPSNGSRCAAPLLSQIIEQAEALAITNSKLHNSSRRISDSAHNQAHMLQQMHDLLLDH
eukprot:1695270-Pyramimonas_sp.AAC.1